jgi:hypothetical protein
MKIEKFLFFEKKRKFIGKNPKKDKPFKKKASNFHFSTR